MTGFFFALVRSLTFGELIQINQLRNKAAPQHDQPRSCQTYHWTDSATSERTVLLVNGQCY